MNYDRFMRKDVLDDEWKSHIQKTQAPCHITLFPNIPSLECDTLQQNAVQNPIRLFSFALLCFLPRYFISAFLIIQTNVIKSLTQWQTAENTRLMDFIDPRSIHITTIKRL